MRPPGPPRVEKQLDRQLGFMAVYAISLGAMMGSGIFVLPGIAAAEAGPWVGLSYLLAGALALPAVCSKAELATAMPVAGGTYVYVDRSLGPWLGTITGLVTWLALSSKTAFALVGLSAYLVLFTAFPAPPVALAVLTALVVLNVVGVGKVTGLQVLIVAVCLVALLAFGFMGLSRADPSLLSPPFPHGASGLIGAAGLVFVSFNGVTKVCSVAEEVREPGRNLPLGMFAAIGTAGILYVGIGTVITSTVPWASLGGDVTPVATAARVGLGEAAGTALAVVALLGLMSMSNAGLLASTRFPFAMARDGTIPAAIGRVDRTRGTPIRAVLLTAALVLVLVVGLPVEELAVLASAFTIFVFAVVNLAVIVLREIEPRWYRPSFRSPLYPWVQLTGILGGGLLLVSMGTLAAIAIAGAVAIGTAWYFGYAMTHSDRKSAFRHLVGEVEVHRHSEIDEHCRSLSDPYPRVIVPVFGREAAPEHLVRLATAFIEEGVLEVLCLEEVPPQANLAWSLAETGPLCHLAEASLAIGDDDRVEVEFRSIVTHHATAALHAHALSTCAEWIVLEHRPRRKLPHLIRNSRAWWLDHPPCDLAVFLDRFDARDAGDADGFHRILVLARPGPYDSLLVHVADRLAGGRCGGRLTLVEPVPECTDDDDIHHHEAYHTQLMLQCRCPRVESRVVRCSDPTGAVIDLSAEHDLLVLGAPKERSLRTLFFGSRVHRLAARARCSVLILKAPRHQVHPRFAYADEATEEALRVEPWVRGSVVCPRLTVGHQQDLFRTLARHLGTSLGVDPSKVERALWDRERQQSTALAEGVSITGPVVAGIERTQLGVFTTAQPLRWVAPGRPPVDVVLTVVAPHEERQIQTWLLGRLSWWAHHGTLLPTLRAALTNEAVRDALRRAEEQSDGGGSLA